MEETENVKWCVFKVRQYTMGCPHVRGENPRALASGLSYVHMGKHGIWIGGYYTGTTYISVDLAHHEIFPAKAGKGCIYM